MRRPMDRCAFNGEGRMLGVLIVPLVPIVLITITLRWPTWKRGCRRGERSTAARSWRGCDLSVMKPLKQAVGPAMVERRRRSDIERLHSTCSDRLLQCAVVTFVEIGVGVGEPRHRAVECRRRTQVGGDRDTVAGAACARASVQPHSLAYRRRPCGCISSTSTEPFQSRN